MLHFGCAPFQEVVEPRLRGGITLRDASHQRLKQIPRRRRTFGDSRQHLHQREIVERRVASYLLRKFDTLLQSFAVWHDILRKADRKTFFGAVGAPRQHHVHHACDTDELRHAHRCAAANIYAAAAFGERIER
jgi:hypothetical protein